MAAAAAIVDVPFACDGRCYWDREWCDYMSSSVEDLKRVVDKAEPQLNRTRSRYRKANMRELPQPISLLTQASGMPWVFRRENIDGRLIIRAERRKRHECFEAQRLNGRLPMKLVPREDDTVYCEDRGHPITKRREQSEDDQDVEGEGFDEQEEVKGDETEEVREGIGCEDGSVQELDPFWKGKGIEGPSGCLVRPSSTPLRPIMTLAM